MHRYVYTYTQTKTIKKEVNSKFKTTLQQKSPRHTHNSEEKQLLLKLNASHKDTQR